MKRYPLLFTFRDLIAGPGFLAGVELCGRALLVEEDEGWWMYGVNPGGMAASSTESHDVVLNEFRRGYIAILQDLARESASVRAFRDRVKRFFSEESDVEEWDRAVTAIRKSAESVDWIRKEQAESPRYIRVHDFTEKMRPGSNPDPYEAEVAIAA